MIGVRDVDVPASHPRALSLQIRNRIAAGVEVGITSPDGLIAHGRGEAFDYLIAEKTNDFAFDAIKVAAAYLVLAQYPVISMNGNVTALVPSESVKLAEVLGCPLEINIFHASSEREKLMERYLLDRGANEVLLPEKEYTLDHIESNRRFVNRQGIYRSDCVYVPLEDGDRCEALVKMGKKVIVVDLNPLSRTARTASVTIVDNVVRVMPLLIDEVCNLRRLDRSVLLDIVDSYNNQEVLARAQQCIRAGRLY
jgi:4-phosphopantoate--beta-alanine ligase